MWEKNAPQPDQVAVCNSLSVTASWHAFAGLRDMFVSMHIGWQSNLRTISFCEYAGTSPLVQYMELLPLLWEHQHRSSWQQQWATPPPQQGCIMTDVSPNEMHKGQ